MGCVNSTNRPADHINKNHITTPPTNQNFSYNPNDSLSIQGQLEQKPHETGRTPLNN